MTRQGRRGAYTRDPVDPEEAINGDNEYVGVAASHLANTDVYHTDPECVCIKLIEIPRGVTERDVNSRGLDVCDECEVGRANLRNPGGYGRDCPYCGEEVRSLPDHLPCEESQ